MRVYRWRQTVTYTVRLVDVGEVDPETGEVAFAHEAAQRESAEEYQRQAMTVEYYTEDFVNVDEGPVEFLGAENVQA